MPTPAPNESPAPASLLAISATFTAEPVGETLRFWKRELGWEDEIRFAPYNQVFQQLLDPQGLIAGNQRGVNIVLARWEDWSRFAPGAPSLAALEDNVRQFVSSVQSAAAAMPCPLLVCICPPSQAFLRNREQARLAARMDEFAEAGLRDIPTVHLLGMRDLQALYPVDEIDDPHGDELGHVPYTPEFFAALGTLLARRIHSLRTAPYKVIVLDCDETLWRGVCGEDGPEGVVIDPPRRALQEFMAAQREAGMLLAIASKNNLEDVAETFRLRTEMPLRFEQFAAHRINWEPKPGNLVSLAEELDLGLDSFIFVDDNPKESGEVRANCPEALALTLPANASDIPAFLCHVWAFDHWKVTGEDRQRAQMYAEQAERNRARRQAPNLEEFLRSLGLVVHIGAMRPEELPRVAQLTQRTSQMNFTTIRRNEGEILAEIERGASCLTVHVSDRFGSYGLTGVMLCRAEGKALAVDTFLLSCRALGRGVEHRMLARLGGIALERGLETVEARFLRTARNVPAQLFLESVAGNYAAEAGGGRLYRIPAEQAAAVRHQPGGTAGGNGDGAVPERETLRAARNSIDYARIAAELREPARILARVRGRAVRRAATSAPYAAPRTDLERRLAAVWEDTLGVTGAGVHDNFFDLGGHSLMAVQLMSRVRQELGVELSLEVVYGGEFTIAELAKAIELKAIEQAGGQDYEALLKEIESLSDEEVRALLQQEGGEGA